MAYVPGCQYDLFISYASENNRDGWVEQFEKALSQELGDLLGRQFSPKDSVFFDKRDLEVGQSFPETLVCASRNSAILVPVLSPGYLTSPWCNQERTEFFSRLAHGAEPAGCLTPILIRPIDEKGLDKLYRDAQRFSFLSEDGQTPLSAGSPAWIARLRDFAKQVKHALQQLRQKSKPVFVGKAVETDRAQNLRAWLRTEIERRYFRTVPESLPALDDPETVRANLQEAGLAIHFMGGADEITLTAIETSVAVCAGATILYQPFGAALTPDEPIWLDAFERGLPTTPGRYQRLQGKNDQELLALIDEQITRVRTAPTRNVAEIDVALICDEADMGSVRQLKQDIATQHAAKVESPDFLESRLGAMERLRKWNDYLSRSDALLFYYGAAERDRLDLIWQKAQQNRPDTRRNWFLAPPDLDRKRRQYPDALWNIDQVVRFMTGERSAPA
ncbi:MAG: toll/interleukin-1 receptor domain-containing protein [Acidobacteriia bacterium]|nr:toll/interleukin-1 receptor domain-containing protein [Terriglobia bacterium]